MIIRQGDTVLMHAGVCRIVYYDAYSVTIEATGLRPGDGSVTYEVALSLNEIAVLTRAIIARQDAAQ